MTGGGRCSAREPSRYYRYPRQPSRGMRWVLELPANLADLLFFSVYTLRGKGKGDGSEVRLLYLSSFGIDAYYPSLLFDGDPEVRRVGRVPIGSIRSFVERRSRHFHLSIVEVYHLVLPLVRLRHTLLLPYMVRQVLPLDAPFEELKRTRFSRDLRRGAFRLIRQHGYTRELAKDERSLRFFHERMFAPHTKARHGALALIYPIESMMETLRRGELLFVHEDGPVSGALCEWDGSRYSLRRTGVLDGDRGLLARGALSAAYSFAILRALELGAREIDFGLSRPFDSDGVFAYKARWGGLPEHERTTTLYAHLSVNRALASPASLPGIARVVRLVGGSLESVQIWEGTEGGLR